MFTLTFTAIDFLVNGTLYTYGLQFSTEWHTQLWWGFFIAYQTAIAAAAIISRSWKLTLVLEAFALSAGQDLVFYAVWGNAVVPAAGVNWTWMGNYHIFGEWTTLTQTLWTTLWVTSALLFTRLNFTSAKARWTAWRNRRF